MILLKKKEFTEEDMRKAIEFGFAQAMEFDSRHSDLENKFISSLRPNSWEVEVEMNNEKEFIPTGIFTEERNPNYKPKITNGTIKVTNIKL